MAKKRARQMNEAEAIKHDEYWKLMDDHGIKPRTKADWLKTYRARQAEIKAAKPKPKRKRRTKLAL